MSDGGRTATVLVVEDDEDVSKLFATTLGDQYNVLTAHNGGEALAQLTDAVDVILLDRRMPDISGDVALEEIESRGMECRIAIISAVDPDFDVIDMGFDNYLVKPVSPNDLLDVVDRLLRLDEYEETYQELSSKLVKKNILEVEKTEGELGNNDRFVELEEEIEQLESELEEMEEGLDERLLPT